MLRLLGSSFHCIVYTMAEVIQQWYRAELPERPGFGWVYLWCCQCSSSFSRGQHFCLLGQNIIGLLALHWRRGFCIEAELHWIVGIDLMALNRSWDYLFGEKSYWLPILHPYTLEGCLVVYTLLFIPAIWLRAVRRARDYIHRVSLIIKHMTRIVAIFRDRIETCQVSL